MTDLLPNDDDQLTDVLTRIASTLTEIYEPAGVLMFWSAPIVYLSHRRPCDLVRDRDLAALELLYNRVEAAADGVFS